MDGIMTALDSQPDTQNFLSNYSFKMAVKRLPNVNWFVQRTNLPGLSLQSTPGGQGNPFVKIPQIGDHITFDALSVEFKMDEMLVGFREIYNWIEALGFPERHKQYRDLAQKNQLLGDGLRSDISIMIITSSRNPILNIVYKDAFPTSLTGVNFDLTPQNTQQPSATVTFEYTSYSIEPV